MSEVPFDPPPPHPQFLVKGQIFILLKYIFTKSSEIWCISSENELLDSKASGTSALA